MTNFHTDNPCLGVTCYNGGYCTSGKCICPGGTSVDKCYGVTCYYGVCSGGTCICNTGYTGSTCLSKIINGGWSAYSASSGCSANCGGGSMSYSRSCNNPAPANGGATCSGSSTKSESCNTHSCPVNGGWSGWSVSSSCTAACGGGSISYKRSCTNPSPAHGGAYCSGSDSKSESCNTHSCPVNGGWSGWSVSSGCTAACGGGSISYKRSCNNPSPAHGGATCSGSDSKSESCNTHSCPVNGGWSGWSATSDCTATCGGGSISYKRTYTNPPPPAHGGAYYSGSDSKSESCNTHSCPVNGGWSGWSVSSGCTAACGGGSISYKRSCNNPSPAHGGATCSGSDSKSESCNTHSCPVNGGWSGWSASSSCTAACGGGSISYKRSCTNPSPAHGGVYCSGSDTKSESCNTHSCPATTSSSCTAVCGGGTISYKRSCTNPSPAHGGATCSGSDSKSESCNTHSCPVNGGWSSWSASSSCTAACGGGSISYKRSCTNPSPAHGGATCSGSDTKSESCNTHSCPVNGGWSDWTATSSCTATCGGGSISYSRTCNNPTPAHGGSDCSGSTTTLEKCNTHACPINGGWSGWTTSSSCTAVCGGGTISYKRSCTNPSPAHGGATCSGSDSKSESCNTHSCPVNGGWSGWSTSSSCTAACGGGSISYKRTCTNPSPAHGGATCSGSDTKSESCNTHSCPVNGGWSDWTATSSCTATCGGGSISYSRTCNNPTPAHGGSDCSGSTTTLEKCNTHACPINGGWSGWSVSSDCTATCGGGSISYKRTCTNPAPAYEGVYCSGEDTKSESCNTHNCPVNGEWSDWTASGCTAACGGGSMSYSRTCNNPAPAHGGDDCSGSRTKSESCNTQSCPVNGGWSDWTSWAACSLDCGGGTQRKTRTCTKPAPTHDGLDCGGDSSASQSCNTHFCPINGRWSDWSPWDTCSVTCGVGTQTKTRSCSNPAPNHGGEDCGNDDSATQTCTKHECPINGRWSDWSPWNTCSVTCGVGTQTKTRSCSNPAPDHGGEDCGNDDSETQTCTKQECPIDECDGIMCTNGGTCITGICLCPSSYTGEVCESEVLNGQWSDWLVSISCSNECGGGIVTYYRTCTNPAPTNGGAHCTGIRTKEEPCNMHDCSAQTTTIKILMSTTTNRMQPSSTRDHYEDPTGMHASTTNGLLRTLTSRDSYVRSTVPSLGMSEHSTTRDSHFETKGPTRGMSEQSTTRDSHFNQTGPTRGMSEQSTTRDPHFNQTGPPRGMSEQSTTRDPHFNQTGPPRDMSEQSTTRDPHFNQTGPTHGMSETINY
ncbi:Hemicentin-1,Coadhesin,Thrombospondin-2,Thrombospondin-1,Mucin-like protein [Mytilus edulis]|uniref:Hemicentin-1,Coadhesin,Thrombospondin-2,Thrombosp ondin-1,Mucin-like protein n=1 Tax=Mytilus edulis TaxID=6550 RepID=A0A8S3SB80_MYTED|nr:Hemicentin-1,Coadhesin,Thrombospondin-2,Thrombospondin-1,Mucin-like protein [Mytilus edulis]